MKGYILVSPALSNGSVRISTFHASRNCHSLNIAHSVGFPVEVDTDKLPEALVNVMTACKYCCPRRHRVGAFLRRLEERQGDNKYKAVPIREIIDEGAP